VSKQYIIWNNSGYTITIYNSTVIGNTTAAGTGVAIADGDKVIVWSDAVNFYDTKSGGIAGTLPIANGGTGQTTANAAFNALAPSQTSANGKYLKSDGTNTAFDQIDISTGDITGTLPVANGGTGVTTLAALGNLFYPVGSIYTNVSVATNPGTLLGFGTWTEFGAGRMLISQNATYPAGTTGGSATTTLITANLPSHSHSITDPGHFHTYTRYANLQVQDGGSTPCWTGQSTINTSTAFTGITGTNNTGSGTAATTISPYISVYMWQRTA
jgi:hypothetical protein